MTMVGAGMIKWAFMEVWTSKAPPTVQVFATMLLKDKILTHEVMEHRGMHCDLDCVMCNDCPVESVLHLLFLCPYATHVWFLVSNALGYRMMKPAMTVQEIWMQSKLARGNRPKEIWTTQFICTLWSTWKSRNQMYFISEEGCKSLQDLRML
ncbi:uncharacterized protein LOC144564383 [Carex rostrata]